MAHKSGTGMFLPLYGRATQLQDEQNTRDVCDETTFRRDQSQICHAESSRLVQHSSSSTSQPEQMLLRAAQGTRFYSMDRADAGASSSLVQQPLVPRTVCAPHAADLQRWQTIPDLQSGCVLSQLDTASGSLSSNRLDSGFLVQPNSPVAVMGVGGNLAIPPLHLQLSSSTSAALQALDAPLSSGLTSQYSSAWTSNSFSGTPATQLYSQVIPVSQYQQQAPSLPLLPSPAANANGPVVITPAADDVTAGFVGCEVVLPVDYYPFVGNLSPAAVSVSSNSTGMPLLDPQGSQAAFSGAFLAMSGGGSVGFESTAHSSGQGIVAGPASSVGLPAAPCTGSFGGAFTPRSGDGVGGITFINSSASNPLPASALVAQQNSQDLALLQQQEAKLAEVDATIQQLLDIKQQLVALHQPVRAAAASAGAPVAAVAAPQAAVAPAAAQAVPLAAFWVELPAQQTTYTVLPMATGSGAASGSICQLPLVPQVNGLGPFGSQQQQGQIVQQQQQLVQLVQPYTESQFIWVPDGAQQQQQGPIVVSQLPDALQFMRLS